MKLFFAFFKTKIRVIEAFILCFCLLFVSFLLYRLPLEALIYPSAICVLVMLSFAGIEFVGVRNKFLMLRNMKNVNSEILSGLTCSGCVICDELKEKLSQMLSANAEMLLADTRKYDEMIEYYTVWVHQIKTPIASMKLALKSEDTPSSRKLLSDLTRIEQYVDMVLVYLRLDSQMSDYVFREYDLDGIIRTVLRKFAPDFILKKLILEFEPTNASLVTDEKWLSFVVEQLISNSLKYTKTGKIGIRMTEERRLCVYDTGIGIGESDLPRVFDKGFTGFNGRTQASSSGIGLYLCKRICKNLGMSIYAESEPGVGTKMYIVFPENTYRVE